MQERRFDLIDDKLYMRVPAVAEGISMQMQGERFEKAEAYIWKALNFNREGTLSGWDHVKDSNDARKVWIEYETIPVQTKFKLLSHYGDVYQVAIKDFITKRALALTQPEDHYYFTDLGHYNPEQIESMVEACGWMRMLNESFWWDDYNLNKIDAFDIAAKVIKSRNLYGLRCGNGLSLYRKNKDWKVRDRDCLLNGNVGGSSNAKGGPNRGVMIDRIIDLYASPTKPTVEKVWEVYTYEATQNGWHPFTRKRIEQILNTPEYKVQWYGIRHGKNKLREFMENDLKRAPLQHADEVWSWDGTTVQIYMDDEGKINKPMYRVTIADGYSGAIIGEAYGETENADVCLEALRLAIGFAGNLPKMLQYDGGIGKMKRVHEALSKLKVLGIKAQPYNGKSKYVERVLGRKEQGIMRFYGNFTGGNVTGTSLQAKSNPDLIKLLHKQGGLPTSRRGVIFQDLIATVLYNSTIIKKYGRTPLQRYAQPDERRTKASPIAVARTFWTETQRKIEYTIHGLVLNVADKRYDYVVETERGLEDQEFRKYWLGAKFRVRYHPDDMDQVMLFDSEDKYIATAVSKYEYSALPMAGEMSTLKKALEQRTRFVTEGMQKQKDRRARLEEQGIPELSFELAHKDAINRAGLEGELLWVEEGAKMLPQRQKPAADNDDDNSIYDVDMDWVRKMAE